MRVTTAALLLHTSGTRARANTHRHCTRRARAYTRTLDSSTHAHKLIRMAHPAAAPTHPLTPTHRTHRVYVLGGLFALAFVRPTRLTISLAMVVRTAWFAPETKGSSH